jgi:hypothetical protein
MTNQTNIDSPWLSAVAEVYRTSATDNERCEECGCLEDDHFLERSIDPSAYDPQIWERRICLDCGECTRDE